MKNNHSRRKKDNSDIPNENYLEQRSRAGEDNKLGNMPVSADNHADTLKTSIISTALLGIVISFFLFTSSEPIFSTLGLFILIASTFLLVLVGNRYYGSETRGLSKSQRRNKERK